MDPWFIGLVSGIFGYLVFLFLLWAFSLCTGPTPLGSFGKWHAIAWLLFTACSMGIARFSDSFTLESGLIAAVTFLLGQYSFGYHWVGLATRSVSACMIADLYLAQRPLRRNEWIKSYANEKGLSWIIFERSNNLVRAKLVENSNERLTVTSKGRLILKLRRILLLSFNLHRSDERA